MDKNIPITDRQVKYASCIYDFNVDGPDGGVKQTTTLPNECIMVSIMVEFLETPTISSGNPLCYITSRGWTGVPVYQFFLPASYTAGDILNFPVNVPAYIPEEATGTLDCIIAFSTLTGGKWAITVGYIDPVYPTTN
jgi:hypothetical protein|tara:strand:- start:169 stop:579 length:411 start_codon:yes stop_codon:yes gene_type:complete